MKHPNLLDSLFPHEVARIQRINIGGKVGVGFAGGGGSSIGLKAAGLKIDFAMNHDAAAIAMHATNCPEALHYCQDIWQVPPGDPCPGEPIRFMWFSPDCKHFSKAKGGAPVEKKIRDLAWVIVLWAKLRRPDVIAIENVEEFQTWGPLILVDGKLIPDPKRKGEYFRAFNREMRKLGYVGDWRELRACDFGTPTSRLRLSASSVATASRSYGRNRRTARRPIRPSSLAASSPGALRPTSWNGSNPAIPSSLPARKRAAPASTARWSTIPWRA